MQSRMCLRIRNCTAEFSTVKIRCGSSVHYILKEFFIIREIESRLSGFDNGTVVEFDSSRLPHGRGGRATKNRPRRASTGELRMSETATTRRLVVAYIATDSGGEAMAPTI